MIGTLYPYLERTKTTRAWVFDDPAKQLKAEAFVMGMSEMIDKIMAFKRFPQARKGFAMTFSDEPIRNPDVCLHWVRQGRIDFVDPKTGEKKSVLIGNWYKGEVAGEPMEGWLCPALLKYFPVAPKAIYAVANRLPEGVDPIWHDVPEKTAFVKSDWAA